MENRNLEEDDFSPGEIAYVPQFSIAHEELTVRECVTYALRLRVRGADCPDFTATVSEILGEVDMLNLESRSVKILSGGQRRRLALAMELTSKPDILLCDEVTSGLDPNSEDDIVRLLHGLSEGKSARSLGHPQPGTHRPLRLRTCPLSRHRGLPRTSQVPGTLLRGETSE